jgi:hypothetical protein
MFGGTCFLLIPQILVCTLSAILRVSFVRLAAVAVVFCRTDSWQRCPIFKPVAELRQDLAEFDVGRRGLT